MISKDIIINGKIIHGIEIRLMNGNLVLAAGSRGFVMCGYLNIETAEKLGDNACIVTGITSVEELLIGKVIKLTSGAEKLGISTGMTGREALKILA